MPETLSDERLAELLALEAQQEFSEWSYTDDEYWACVQGPRDRIVLTAVGGREKAIPVCRLLAALRNAARPLLLEIVRRRADARERVAALRERAEAAEAERDRQYEENVGRIAAQAAAESRAEAAEKDRDDAKRYARLLDRDEDEAEAVVRNILGCDPRADDEPVGIVTLAGCLARKLEAAEKRIAELERDVANVQWQNTAIHDNDPAIHAPSQSPNIVTGATAYMDAQVAAKRKTPEAAPDEEVIESLGKLMMTREELQAVSKLSEPMPRATDATDAEAAYRSWIAVNHKEGTLRDAYLAAFALQQAKIDDLQDRLSVTERNRDLARERVASVTKEIDDIRRDLEAALIRSSRIRAADVGTFR